MAKHFALTTIITFLILPTQMYAMDGESSGNKLAKHIIDIAGGRKIKFDDDNNITVTAYNEKHENHTFRLFDNQIKFIESKKIPNDALFLMLLKKNSPCKTLLTKHSCTNYNELLYNKTKDSITFISGKKICAYIIQTKKCLFTISVPDDLFDLKYNNDESLMLINFYDDQRILQQHILDIQSHKTTNLFTFDDNIFATATEFHPNNIILATFTLPNNLIQYWNKKRRCFAQQQLINLHQKRRPELNKNLLSISPDGKLIAVALTMQCLILEIPFETIGKNPYPLDTKQKMLYLLCVLNSFQHNNTPLPKEIIQLLIQKTLKTLRLRTGLSHG